MNPITDAIKSYLLASETIQASPVYNRIYVDHWLPDGYKRSSGAAMVLRPRGGAGANSFIMMSSIFEFRCFAETADIAFEADNALFTVMQELWENPQTTIYPTVISSSDLSRSEGGFYVVSQQFQISMVNC